MKPNVLHHLISRLHTVRASIAWSCIALSCLLCLTPIFLTAQPLVELQNFSVLASLPVLLGSLLRLRRGAFTVYAVFQIGIGLRATISFGLAWPSALVSYWLVSAVMGCLLAFALGQFSYLGYALNTANAALAATNAHLERLATTDPLTGLLNHGALATTLASALATAHTTGAPCSLIFLDIDHFKAINDRYGHAAGDVVLQSTAKIVGDQVAHAGSVGRWGGEEFLVVLPTLSPDQARVSADAIRRAVAAHPIALSDTDIVTVTCSLGIATFPSDAPTFSGLVEASDQAMYTAKRTGRNCVCFAGDNAEAGTLPLVA